MIEIYFYKQTNFSFPPSTDLLEILLFLNTIMIVIGIINNYQLLTKLNQM